MNKLEHRYVARLLRRRWSLTLGVERTSPPRHVPFCNDVTYIWNVRTFSLKRGVQSSFCLPFCVTAGKRTDECLKFDGKVVRIWDLNRVWKYKVRDLFLDFNDNWDQSTFVDEQLCYSLTEVDNGGSDVWERLQLVSRRRYTSLWRHPQLSNIAIPIEIMMI